MMGKAGHGTESFLSQITFAAFAQPLINIMIKLAKLKLANWS